MARARNIKPAFFMNEVLVGLPFEYRLLFIGIWTLADREGRLEDRPIRIKMEVFPADNVDVDAGLQALHDAGFILRYQVESTRYIQVITWAKHQNPHHREASSTIPAPAEPRAGVPCTGPKPEDGTRPAPESTGSAVLIPDSGFLIPDSKEEPNGSLSAKADTANCPHNEIIALYHEILPANPRIKVWDGARADSLRTRWREDPKRQSLDYWRRFFGHVAASPFLTGKVEGKNGRTFLPGLDWLVKAANFAKVIENRYHDGAAA